MRRDRKIRKVVKITIPKEVSANGASNISRGKVGKNTIKRVKPPTVVNRDNSKYIQNGSKVKHTYTKIEPIWQGQTVYLIGGGPSLKGFEWNRLKGKKTIAINKALKFYPNADAVYWTDGRVYSWLEKEINNFKGLKYTIRAKSYATKVNLLRRGKKFGLEKATNSIAHGNNSGYAAINLAIHLGAKRIILLGYDMGQTNQGSHFHDGYPVNATSAKIYKEQFIPGFDLLKKELAGKDIQIFNACPTSNLKTFPIITIEEALGFR